MSRLIDADALIEKASTCRETTDAFIELVNEMPTAGLSSHENIGLLMHVSSEIFDLTGTAKGYKNKYARAGFIAGIEASRSVIKRMITGFKNHG